MSVCYFIPHDIFGEKRALKDVNICLVVSILGNAYIFTLILKLEMYSGLTNFKLENNAFYLVRPLPKIK